MLPESYCIRLRCPPNTVSVIWGPEAYRFADFLHRTRQAYWQILPLHPTDDGCLNSPYLSDSAFAGNTMFISPDLLAKEELIRPVEPDFVAGSADRVDYESVRRFKEGLFDEAFAKFRSNSGSALYNDFLEINEHWLEEHALFTALKEKFGGRPWSEWPDPIRFRDHWALDGIRNELAERIERERFLQYIFYRQWSRLRRYCRSKGVSIIGDLPIYVHYDSVDVWSHPEIFKLDDQRRPYVVAGVPPDYFSATGQLWGNPIYNWTAMADQRYEWWIRRIRRILELTDFIRIDHFRGLVGYWEVPAHEETAVNGQWIEAPAMDFLKNLIRAFPTLPFIAEDLGLITPDVINVINYFGLPGMKVLLFAFGDDVSRNPFAPHNHISNSVVYTGTHDNNTVRGWFEHDARPDEKERLFQYLGREVCTDDIAPVFLRLAMGSVADTILVPLQDVLGLGREARMNTPGTKTGNWTWRFRPEMIHDQAEEHLRRLTELYGRGG